MVLVLLLLLWLVLSWEDVAEAVVGSRVISKKYVQASPLI